MPHCRFSSEENKSVRRSIIQDILSQPNCKFEEKTIHRKFFRLKVIINFTSVIVAVKRCYENLRRTLLEQQTGKENFIENQAKRRKYRSRRERVCTLKFIVYCYSCHSKLTEISKAFFSGDKGRKGEVLEAFEFNVSY